MCLPIQAAAAVLQAYPPRGGLNLNLSVQQKPIRDSISAIDRIVIQEYVIDTIHFFDGDNNELARRLGIGRAHLAAPLAYSAMSRLSACFLMYCALMSYLALLDVQSSTGMQSRRDAGQCTRMLVSCPVVRHNTL